MAHRCLFGRFAHFSRWWRPTDSDGDGGSVFVRACHVHMYALVHRVIPHLCVSVRSLWSTNRFVFMSIITSECSHHARTNQHKRSAQKHAVILLYFFYFLPPHSQNYVAQRRKVLPATPAQRFVLAPRLQVFNCGRGGQRWWSCYRQCRLLCGRGAQIPPPSSACSARLHLRTRERQRGGIGSSNDHS